MESTCQRANHLFELLRMGCSLLDLKSLLDSYAPNEAEIINFIIAMYDETCLSLALTRTTTKRSPKRLAVVDLLLERGGDPNHVFLSGITIFQLVVWWDDLQLVMRLLDCPQLNIENTKALIYSKSTTNVMLHMFAVYRAYEKTEDFGLSHILAEIADLPAPAQVLKIISAEDRLKLGHLAREVLAMPRVLLQVFKNKESSAHRIEEVACVVAGFLNRPAAQVRGFERILHFL
jgi:hypothetical protein